MNFLRPRSALPCPAAPCVARDSGPPTGGANAPRPVSARAIAIRNPTQPKRASLIRRIFSGHGWIARAGTCLFTFISAPPGVANEDHHSFGDGIHPNSEILRGQEPFHFKRIKPRWASTAAAHPHPDAPAKFRAATVVPSLHWRSNGQSARKIARRAADSTTGFAPVRQSSLTPCGEGSQFPPALCNGMPHPKGRLPPIHSRNVFGPRLPLHF